MTRRSAPLGLRLSVLALVLGLLCAMGGVVAERLQPAWFVGLRNHAAVASGSEPRVSRAEVAAPARFHVLLSSTHAVEYLVPSRDYSLVVVVNKPVWYRVNSPVNSPTPLIEGMELPTQSPLAIAVKDSASIMVAARTLSISVEHGSRTFGTITLPHAGVVYDFVSSSGDG